jgi:hypothetical protein
VSSITYEPCGTAVVLPSTGTLNTSEIPSENTAKALDGCTQKSKAEASSWTAAVLPSDGTERRRYASSWKTTKAPPAATWNSRTLGPARNVGGALPSDGTLKRPARYGTPTRSIA